MNDNKKETKQYKKYRPVKCVSEICDGSLDIDYIVSIGDYDYCDSNKGSIYVYCPKCGLQHKVKL